MEHVTVELDLSRDLLGTLQVTGQELEPELKLLIALEPFREETISCGKAAGGGAGGSCARTTWGLLTA